MKEALGLTWHQEKERRRLWKKVGVSIASEHQERKFFKEEVTESVTVDRITVPTDGKLGQSEKAEPVALVPDLEKFVKNLLDKLDAEGKLTWHENGIPEDEIWIKIGRIMGEVVSKFVVSLLIQRGPTPVTTLTS